MDASFRAFINSLLCFMISQNHSTFSPVPIESANPAAGLCHHLAQRFDDQWKIFSKKFKRCRQKLSKNNTHALRVATRKLNATLGILRDLNSDKTIDKCEKQLKKVFKTLAPLRENYVQRGYLEEMKQDFSAAEKFQDRLRKQKSSLEKRAQRKMRFRKLTKLRSYIASIEQWFCALLAQGTAQESCLQHSIKAVRRKYDQAVTLVKNIDPANTKSIHRARVAFKGFRYAFESLHPAIVKIPESKLTAMDRYQTRMGKIQDLQDLGEAVCSFAKSRRAKETARLGSNISHEKQAAIDAYLHAAHEIKEFCPEDFLISPQKNHHSDMHAPSRNSHKLSRQRRERGLKQKSK